MHLEAGHFGKERVRHLNRTIRRRGDLCWLRGSTVAINLLTVLTLDLVWHDSQARSPG